jgi:AcrR family transcriptional regulator
MNQSSLNTIREGVMAKGDDTRNAILRTAVSKASVEGLEGLTIGGLAKEMGLSKSGLIAHFGTKEGLQLGVLQAAAAMFANRVIRPARRTAPGEDRLRTYFENWVRWSHAPELPGGCLFISATIDLDDRPGICRYYLAKVQKEWVDALEGAALEAREAGQFRETLDPAQIAFGMTGIMHSIHLYERLFRDRAAEARGRAAFTSLMTRARRPDDTDDDAEE